MCVIVHKPAKVAITAKDLGNMWKTNPDGAGIAWYDSKRKKLAYYKGIMEFDLLKAEVDKRVDQDLVIHLRIATHGAVCAQNCHPFEIRKDQSRTQGKTGKVSYTENLLFHNGIISGYGSRAVSDTVDFITRTLSEIPEKIRTEVLSFVSSKFIYWSVNNGMTYVGNFTKVGQLSCSNTYWQPVPLYNPASFKGTGKYGSQVSIYGSSSYDDSSYIRSSDTPVSSTIAIDSVRYRSISRKEMQDLEFAAFEGEIYGKSFHGYCKKTLRLIWEGARGELFVLYSGQVPLTVNDLTLDTLEAIVDG